MNQIKSEEDLISFINSHKFKLEIGACSTPLCDGINTIFVDSSKTNLEKTMKKIDSKSSTFLNVDAAEIPLKDSSIDCIVSSYFSWHCYDEHTRSILFIEMLSEWSRIVKKTGHIVIKSEKKCIQDMLQLCDIVKLYPLAILHNRRTNYTLIFKKK